MSSVQSLKRLIRSVRKKVFQQGHTFRPKPIIPGLPDTISCDTLSTLCLNHFSSPVVKASHQHLSAWKVSGAYRLLLILRNGQELRLILKEASYDQQEIPALIGLPAIPGKAEYCIYSQASGPLEPFLPGVILAEEIQPGVRYRYILEDLSDHYHRIGQKESAVKASSLLPDFHEAMRAWTQEMNSDGLIRYDQKFSRSLQEYARNNLIQFQSVLNDPTLQNALDRWPDITEMHLEPEFFSHQLAQPIHGDMNFTNIHINKTGPDHIKLVDWEWAGIGSPFADLASLTKGAPSKTGTMVLDTFINASSNGGSSLNKLSARQLRRIYHWCQLERGMLDAGFLAAQYLHSDRKANFNLAKAVSSSIHRMVDAYHHLNA